MSNKVLKLLKKGHIYHASGTPHIPERYAFSYFIGWLEFGEALKLATAGSFLSKEQMYVLNQRGEVVVAISPFQSGGIVNEDNS